MVERAAAMETTLALTERVTATVTRDVLGYQYVAKIIVLSRLVADGEKKMIAVNGAAHLSTRARRGKGTAHKTLTA